MNEELLPCPFCGGTASKINVGYWDDDIKDLDPFWPTIWCKKCEGQIAKQTMDRAIIAWNERA